MEEDQEAGTTTDISCGQDKVSIDHGDTTRYLSHALYEQVPAKSSNPRQSRLNVSSGGISLEHNPVQQVCC